MLISIVNCSSGMVGLYDLCRPTAYRCRSATSCSVWPVDIGWYVRRADVWRPLQLNWWRLVHQSSNFLQPYFACTLKFDQLHLRVTVLGIGHTHFSYLFALYTFLTVILLPVCYTRTVISLTLNFHVLVCVLTCLVYNKMNEWMNADSTGDKLTIERCWLDYRAEWRRNLPGTVEIVVVLAGQWKLQLSGWSHQHHDVLAHLKLNVRQRNDSSTLHVVGLVKRSYIVNKSEYGW